MAAAYRVCIHGFCLDFPFSTPAVMYKPTLREGDDTKAVRIKKRIFIVLTDRVDARTTSARDD